MLELALNYVTVSIAAALLVTLIVLFFIKRKQLSKVQKTIICCAGAIIAIYFVFVAILVFAFGNTHPLGGPKPVENLASSEHAEQSVLPLADTPAPGGMGSSQRIAPVIQEEVTAVTITHRVGGTEMVSVVTGDDLNELRTWAAWLRYNRKTFPTKQSPGDAEGNEVYSLVLTGGEYPDFDYIISGADNYLLMQGEWHLVSNPSAPPYDKNAESPADSYHFTRYGKEGEVISIAALTDEKLAERIIMDVTEKSAAWQGVDMATLTECYLIEQTFGTGEKSEYYAYLLDGKAVLQRGNNGLYSYLSQELYDELDGIYTNSVERTEP